MQIESHPDELGPAGRSRPRNPVEIIEEQLPPPDTPGLGSPAAVAAVCLCGVFAFLDLYVTQPLLPLFTRVFHAPNRSPASP